jgi:(p)ppGpp synthase/HD superfamily hydrolase
MKEDNKNLIPLARDFALKAHEKRITNTVSGLKRPQILHLQEVADLVWISGGSDDEIAAAWLHDSVEDTPTTLNDIAARFGDKIAEMIKGLTDLEEFADLPVTERKQKQARRVQRESESVRRVKLADQASNVRALALDPTIKMTALECKEYIEGAKLIAHECRGISSLLDELFLKIYQEARERKSAL